MNQMHVILVTSLVTVPGTALVTMAVSWFTSRVAANDENRKWRRDRALEAYSDFLLAVEMVRLEAYVAHTGPDCGTIEHAKQHGIVHDKLAEMYRAQQRASLIAPHAVYLSLAKLGLHVAAEIAAKWSRCPKIDESEITPTLEKYTQLQLTLTKSARKYLNIPSPLRRQVPTEPWWRFWKR